MEHFTLDNTEGYNHEQLDRFNALFEEWAEKNGFDISDKHTDEYENASGKFFDKIMIYGQRVLNTLDCHLAVMLPNNPSDKEIEQEKEIFFNGYWPDYLRYKRDKSAYKLKME
jgi:sugar/nucleoside kinase (ribokinase family)